MEDVSVSGPGMMWYYTDSKLKVNGPYHSNTLRKMKENGIINVDSIVRLGLKGKAIKLKEINWKNFKD